MNATRIACYALIASAFVLGGLLIARVGDLTAQPAHANMILAEDNLIAMTARISNNEEALFVFDTGRGRMVVYQTQNRRDRGLYPTAAVDVGRFFDAIEGAAAADPRRR